MRVTVNGETYETTATELSIATLLTERGVESPAMVAVQKNGAIVVPGTYDREPVHDGDDIEFLFFMGGGGR